MPILQKGELALAEALSGLPYVNPFLPERIDGERRILGDGFDPSDPVWHPGAGARVESPNISHLAEIAEKLAEALRDRMLAGEKPSEKEKTLYLDIVLYVLYHRFKDPFFERITGRRDFGFYRDFEADLERATAIPGFSSPRAGSAAEGGIDPAHLFACFFQIRRAFQFTFRHIIGASMPAARLRAEVWESIFTHDLRRYLRFLYDKMGDLSTLILGPSGTGKELMARAIGLSRFIPFDPASLTFEPDFEETFFALDLSARSPTLIESELFGHVKGSFTGAVTNRPGWFEQCPPEGTVFLDEIGELDGSIQIKLLRLLETRRFQRLGDLRERSFLGKVIAATNRDLPLEVRDGRFREDLYYRLCSDIICSPSLEERLADRPEELGDLVLYLVQSLVGESEAPAVAAEAESWITENLGPGYPWPGNVRELGQCVRNVLIRKSYRPARPQEPSSPRQRLAEEFLAAELPADELLGRYCTLVYLRSGSYQEAGRRLGLDRRTVKSRVDRALLDELRGRAGVSSKSEAEGTAGGKAR